VLVDEQKKALRGALASRRLAIDTARRSAAGQAVADRFLDDVAPPPGAVISGFWPSKGEIDVLPLLGALVERGHECALPVVVARGQPLRFRAWRPETELIDGVFGIPVPPPDAATVTPDLLLVPLLAFDRAGYRLGWGGGFYDRTLEALRSARPVVAVGVAFSDQEVDAVPYDSHDHPLDWVVTERETISIGREPGNGAVQR